MSPELVEALRRWKAKQAERALKEGRGEVPRRIFPMPSPKSGADLVRVAFKRVLKKARLPSYFSPHCARHTYASILLSEDGGRLLYVQEQLGHASIQETVDTYGKWPKKDGRGAMDSLCTKGWKAAANGSKRRQRLGFSRLTGNQLFPGAEIIGHRLCAASFGKERPELMQMLRNAGGSEDPMLRDMARQLAAWDFTGVTLTPPTTLIEDRLALDLDGIAVHLIYVGPAHTAGDVIVHLPAARVVFTGDILFRLCTPIGWEGTYERWIAALDTIVALDPAVVVPGHGPLSGLEGPREMQAYLRYVRAEAKRWFDAGLPALEAARRIDLGPYAGWTEPERILFNVERAYRELRGEPYDVPIDATALFRGMYELRASRRAVA